MVARVGKSYQGDIAIDDITFVNGTCHGKPLNVTQGSMEGQEMEVKGEPGNKQTF